MALFSPAVRFVAQLWYAIDAGNAVRHGMPVSEKAKQHCMTTPAPASQEVSSDAVVAGPATA